MRYKIFGERTGLKVSEFALGTGMFGRTSDYGATPEEARLIIEGFADAGGNFIDTADNYKHGVSETTIGNVIASNRDDFVIIHLDGMYSLISPDGTQEMQFQDYVVPSSAAWRVVVRQLELWLAQMNKDSGGQ